MVDQMLTGFDSKWLNTLYLDKTIMFENIIQAFSRTNRVFNASKPFGSIRYYRRPHTMEQNVEKAVKLYSGDKPYGIFASHLDTHLGKVNECFEVIKGLFKNAPDFSQLPEDLADQGEFAAQFSELYKHLQAAQVQGFNWSQDTYVVNNKKITVELNEDAYYALVARYKELSSFGGGTGNPGGGGDSVSFDVNAHITHIDTDRIDSDYLNSKFIKYVRALDNGVDSNELDALREELHSSFARLSAEDQKFANRWLHDLQSGEVTLEDGKTVQDYINDYRLTARESEINIFVDHIGVDATLLRAILDANVTLANLNEYGRFEDLMEATDREKAKTFFEWRDGTMPSNFKITILLDELLRDYILTRKLPDGLIPNTE